MHRIPLAVGVSYSVMNETPSPSGHRRSRSRRRKPVILGKSEHRISPKDIDPDIVSVIQRLKRQGFITYISGAAVQNLLQGIPPKDFDIVTNARPGQIKRRFAHAHVIGRRFRLVHISIGKGKIIEVATFRREPDVLVIDTQEGKLRRKSTYGTPREDAFRRDISINALYYDLSTNAVIDYVRGLKDLKERRIRVIGDPGARYEEDPVRIIRVVRHAARLGFSIEKRTDEAIYSHLHLLNGCSKARLYEELNKDLAGKTRPVFEAYNRYGILKYLIGDAGEDYHTDRGLSSGLFSQMDLKDRANTLDPPLDLEEVYALVLWPWIKSRYPFEKGDLQTVLGEALQVALTTITVPRKIRADILQILILLQYMSRAVRTGRSRQSWKKRPQYRQASRLFYILNTGRIPHGGESFDSLMKDREYRPNQKSRRKRSS